MQTIAFSQPQKRAWEGPMTCDSKTNFILTRLEAGGSLKDVLLGVSALVGARGCSCEVSSR